VLVQTQFILFLQVLTTANFTETTTTDIGTTTGVTFTVAVSGSNAVLSSSATTAGWTVKTIIRSI